MKPRKMRLFSILLCLVLALCALPLTALADGPNDEGYPLLQEYYQSDTVIWYTEASGKSPVDYQNIQSVSLGGIAVPYDSDGTPGKNGLALNTIYIGKDNTTDAGTATLSITPKNGYYVTKVVIACCHQNKSAFNCDTWKHDCAFTKSFNMASGLNVSIDVTSNNFGHKSKANKYFIIIETAQIPDPVYVIYKAGEMSNNSAFSGETWMPASNTSFNTQYEYDTTDENDIPFTPSHPVQAIASDALTAARIAGKEFSHWELKYYKGVTFDSNGKISSLSDELSSAANKNPADVISLPVHAELTAIWKDVEKIDLPVTKTWIDNNNQDGMRPESITVNLLADGVSTGKTLTITSAAGWKGSFTDLPYKDENGKVIKYTITENPIDGYTSSIDGYTITNTRTPEKISVSGSKTWDDSNNQDGMRPESITIHLLANGEKVASKTVTAADNWTWNFTELDKYDDGKEIIYSIQEDAVPGYTSTINGYNVINTHETATIDISGTKKWVDNDNAAGIRPESITVHLLKNGVKFDSVVVTAETDWKYSFTDLDEYADGEEIIYTISEDPVAGYSSVIEGYNITNTVIPESPSEPSAPEETDPPVPTNPPAETPQTGDNIALGVLCTLLAIGGIGIAGTLFFFTKKKHTT